MVALTYSEARTAAKTAPVAEVAAPRKSFFRRFLDAMIEARMIQAQRELAAFRHVVPHARRDNDTTGGW